MISRIKKSVKRIHSSSKYSSKSHPSFLSISNCALNFAGIDPPEGIDEEITGSNDNNGSSKIENASNLNKKEKFKLNIDIRRRPMNIVDNNVTKSKFISEGDLSGSQHHIKDFVKNPLMPDGTKMFDYIDEKCIQSDSQIHKYVKPNSIDASENYHSIRPVSLRANLSQSFKIVRKFNPQASITDYYHNYNNSDSLNSPAPTSNINKFILKSHPILELNEEGIIFYKAKSNTNKCFQNPTLNEYSKNLDQTKDDLINRAKKEIFLNHDVSCANVCCRNQSIDKSIEKREDVGVNLVENINSMKLDEDLNPNKTKRGYIPNDIHIFHRAKTIHGIRSAVRNFYLPLNSHSNINHLSNQSVNMPLMRSLQRILPSFNPNLDVNKSSPDSLNLLSTPDFRKRSTKQRDAIIMIRAPLDSVKSDKISKVGLVEYNTSIYPKFTIFSSLISSHLFNHEYNYDAFAKSHVILLKPLFIFSSKDREMKSSLTQINLPLRNGKFNSKGNIEVYGKDMNVSHNDGTKYFNDFSIESCPSSPIIPHLTDNFRKNLRSSSRDVNSHSLKFKRKTNELEHYLYSSKISEDPQIYPIRSTNSVPFRYT
ncbi:unnamed protein product [Gordionus sp. m RMFG-2023]